MLILIFALGYIAIVAEHTFRIHKSASALVMGVLCWATYALSLPDGGLAATALNHHLSDISGILLFLMGAMTIVEVIDMHDGFTVITDYITSTNAVRLLWLISGITFILSAILDNLTTAIVMVTVLHKMLKPGEDRRLMAAMVVIAANAGGAFSPIGDVTTTMLWLGGQLTPAHIIASLFAPSLLSLAVPLLYVSFKLKGRKFSVPDKASASLRGSGMRYIILITGLLLLMLVPVFKAVTHLPPYMGILLGLGLLWVLTEIIHRDKDKEDQISPLVALGRIDMSSILFFFGILAAVACLQSAGYLEQLALQLDRHVGNKDLIATIIGVASAVIDNVPLVAACTGMYDLQHYPTDSKLWEFLAYATGTGGSILIVGSAAGVAVMGMEKIDFMWYLKHVSLIALLGYMTGVAAYVCIYAFTH